MKGLGGIGRTQRVADRAALVAIDEVVLDSAQGDGLRYIPVGVVKGQCGGGDGRFAGVAGSNRDGDGAVGDAIELTKLVLLLVVPSVRLGELLATVTAVAPLSAVTTLKLPAAPWRVSVGSVEAMV